MNFEKRIEQRIEQLAAERLAKIEKTPVKRKRKKPLKPIKK